MSDRIEQVLAAAGIALVISAAIFFVACTFNACSEWKHRGEKCQETCNVK